MSARVLLFAILLAVPPQRGAREAEPIRLEIDRWPGAGLLACGPIAFPQGRAHADDASGDGWGDVTLIVLRDAATGQVVPSELWSVWRWADGSVRAGTLFADLTGLTEETHLRLESCAESRGVGDERARGLRPGRGAARPHRSGEAPPGTSQGEKPPAKTSGVAPASAASRGKAFGWRERSGSSRQETAQLETGPLEVTLPARGPLACFKLSRGSRRSEVEFGRLSLPTPAPRDVSLRGVGSRGDPSPRSSREGVSRVELLHCGPLVAVVAVRRLLPGDGGIPDLEATLYLTLVRESAAVDFTLLLVAQNEGVTTGLPYEWRWKTPLPLRVTIAHVVENLELRSGQGVDIRSTECGAVEILAPGGAQPLALDGELRFRLESGPPELSGNSSGSLAFAVDRFAQLTPRAVRLLSGGSVLVDLFAAPRAWERGSGLRLDGVLLIGSEESHLRPAAWSRRARLRPRLGSLAEDPLLEAWTGPHCQLPSARAEAQLAILRLEREVEAVNGALDHGDYRTSWGAFANLEYDPVLAVLLTSLGERDATPLPRGPDRSLVLVEAMLRHWTGQDIVRGRDLRDGLPWMHGWEHRSGRVELGHVFLSGALAGRVLFPDALLAEVVQRAGDGLLRAVERGEALVNERSAGWTLLNLADLAETRHGHAREGVLACLRTLVRAVVERQGGDGAIRLDTTRRGDEACHLTNVWVTSMTTVEGLRAALRVTAESSCRQALERLLGWLARLVSDSPPGEIPERLFWNAETGELCGQEGACGASDSLLIAAALVRGSAALDNAPLGEVGVALAERCLREPLDGSSMTPAEAVRRLRALAALQ
ncbi:MAG: hypothetical protein AB1486_19190 [Planctomycetota bacterium]